MRAVYTSVKNTWQDAENLDDTHGYTTYIWIPEETFKVDVMKLRVYAEKFRAYSKSALAGGAQTKTSTAGGAHSHTVTGATSSYVTPSHTHDVVIGVKTSSSENSHKHPLGGSVVNSNYTVDGMFPVYDADSNFAGYVLVSNYQSGRTPFTYGAPSSHAHDVDYGTKTSASGGASHAHTVSGQTAEAVTNHSHDVTIDDHTHPIDFGIYEEDITGRTLSAKLYDPDGSLLKDFGVVLTGEDSDVIDLSEFFATLKYGMYRMVLSASGRLRARLVFYELAKMYAQY